MGDTKCKQELLRVSLGVGPGRGTYRVKVTSCKLDPFYSQILSTILSKVPKAFVQLQ